MISAWTSGFWKIAWDVGCLSCRSASLLEKTRARLDIGFGSMGSRPMAQRNTHLKVACSSMRCKPWSTAGSRLQRWPVSSTEAFPRFATGCVSSACNRQMGNGGARRRRGQSSLSLSVDAMGGQSSSSREAAITAASNVAGRPSHGGDELSSRRWSKRREAHAWSAATVAGWGHCSFTTSTPRRRSSTSPYEAIRVRSPGAGRRFGNVYCSAPTATLRSRVGSLLCRWISSRRPGDRLGRRLLSPN